MPLHFNWLDILLGGVLVFIVVHSLWMGFSRSVSTLLGVILGFWAAINWFPSLSVRLAPWIQNELWCSIIAFILLFLLVYLAFLIAGILVQGLFRVLKLSWVDRLLGALVGLVKGLVVAGAIVFLLTVFLPQNSPLLRKSALYPELSRVAQVMGLMVPVQLKGRFMWKWRRLHIDPGKTRQRTSV